MASYACAEIPDQVAEEEIAIVQVVLIECCVLPVVLPHAAAALKDAAVGPGDDALVPLQQQRGLMHSPCRPGHHAANQVGLRQPVRGYLRLGDPAHWQRLESKAMEQLQDNALRRQQQQRDGQQQQEAQDRRQQRGEGWSRS